MTPLEIAIWLAIAIVVALVAGYLLAKRMASAAPPKFVLDAEAEAWNKVEELLEFAASSKGDKAAIAAAQARIAAREQRTAAFKAKVAGL